MAFTVAQQAQVDRIPASYFRPVRPVDMSDSQFESMMNTKLETRTPIQLRARANITGVTWSHPPVVNYSSQNDYNASEMEAIGHELRAGDKWGDRVPEIVAAGPSVEQRLTAGGL